MGALSLEAAPATRRSAGAALALLGGAGAAVLLGCGARIVLAATADPRLLVAAGRRTGYPAWMRGPLRGHSSPITVHTFLVMTGLMVVGWLALLVASRHLSGGFLAVTLALATATFALAPPLLSTDVFNYIAYAQMGMRGVNPYLHGPAVLIGQPIYGYTGHLWKHTPSAYGPLFTLITYALWPLGIAGAYWALKAVGALALLAVAALVWASARVLGRDPRLAVVLVCLNPLVLLYALGGAHNDLLMAVPLAAAVYLAATRRPASAGAACVAAIAIKASAGLALPFVLLGARPRRRALAGAAGAAALTAAVSVLAFGKAITKMPAALLAQQRFHWIVVSVPSFVGHYAKLGTPGHAARFAFTLVAVVVIVVAAVRARGGRGWLEGAAAAMLVVLFTAAWVLPWYIVWALPFAALVRRPALPALAVVLTVLLVAMQLVHFGVTHASHHRHHHVLTQRRAAACPGRGACSS